MKCLPCKSRKSDLFFAHKHVDGRSGVVPILANLVLEIAQIGLFHPLREVAEEDEDELD